MPPPDLDQLLDERRRRRRRWGARIGSALVALFLHGALLLGALLAPRLFAAEPTPITYVPVLLVPPPPLGVESPPARAEPVKEAPPPEPAPPTPAPEPEVPALPPPEPVKKQEEPKPEPPAPRPAPPPPTPRPGSPTGSATATATHTAAVAGIEDPNFTYGYYLDRLVALVRSRWVRPSMGSGIEATVRFEVLPDGNVRDLRILVSSGYTSFDLAAMRAVQAASPLPPLPRSYRESYLGVRLIFR